MKRPTRTTAWALGAMLSAATMSAQGGPYIASKTGAEGHITRQPVQAATGVCNGALPSYEAALRKRPLGITNEGNSPAFISCATPGNNSALHLGNAAAALYVANGGAAPVTVNCTFVDGIQISGAQYRPRSITLNPGEYGEILWLPNEYGLTAFSQWANFNCALPVGVQINEVLIQYPEYIGA
jgi:hypothetical protein